MKKTNAARLLDRQKIVYRLMEYEVDPEDLSAPHVAQKIGWPLARVFKTLVARGDKNGVLLACIPGGDEVDLKNLAVESGNKKVEMVHLREVQGLTGYIRGGVSPLGAKKDYPVYIDESIRQWSEIAISAGVRGCQLCLAPEALIRAVQGKVCSITREAFDELE